MSSEGEDDLQLHQQQRQQQQQQRPTAGGTPGSAFRSAAGQPGSDFEVGGGADSGSDSSDEDIGKEFAQAAELHRSSSAGALTGGSFAAAQLPLRTSPSQQTQILWTLGVHHTAGVSSDTAIAADHTIMLLTLAGSAPQSPVGAFAPGTPGSRGARGAPQVLGSAGGGQGAEADQLIPAFGATLARPRRPVSTPSPTPISRKKLAMDSAASQLVGDKTLYGFTIAC
jgi:hypothetical protein